MNNLVEFLEGQMTEIEAQITSLTLMKHALSERVHLIEGDLMLAAAGLARGDALAITPSFLEVARLSEQEASAYFGNEMIGYVKDGVPYDDVPYESQVVIATRPDRAMWFSVRLDVAQGMKRAYQEAHP